MVYVLEMLLSNSEDESVSQIIVRILMLLQNSLLLSVDSDLWCSSDSSSITDTHPEDEQPVSGCQCMCVYAYQTFCSVPVLQKPAGANAADLPHTHPLDSSTDILPEGALGEIGKLG